MCPREEESGLAGRKRGANGGETPLGGGGKRRAMSRDRRCSAYLLAIVQIFHRGARSPESLIGQRPWSAVELPGDPNNPRAGTAEEITRVIGQFRDAAVCALSAGFDGVELHGAHGYLLGQFLSALNTRSDGWGSDLAGRARRIREATRAVRAAVPASFLVGVRLSPEDFGNAKGLDLDESLQVAKWLCEDGIDFLHISLWTASNNTKKRPAEHPIPLFRAACPADVALFVAGKVWTRAEADALLEKSADVMALGRSAMINPEWPQHAAEPGWEPKRPPISVAELVERGLSEKFAGYLRIWKGFVAD